MDLMWWLEREDQEFCQVFHLYNWVDMISILEVGTMKSASYTWNLTQCTENVEIAVIQVPATERLFYFFTYIILINILHKTSLLRWDENVIVKGFMVW